MSEFFEEVKIEKVSDKIVNQMKALIIEGKLKPGDKLPGERELTEMLGVGRSSIREAMNILETMGYIEIKKRKGYFVKSITSTLQLDPLKQIFQKDKSKIVQLYEIRNDLERGSAYYAAQNRSKEDLEEIQRCLSDFKDQNGNLIFTWDKDKNFHIAIAQATHNFLRIHVIKHIFDFSREFIKEPIEFLIDDNKHYLDELVKQHEQIYKAIEEKNCKKSSQLMSEHLNWINLLLDKGFL